MLSVAEARDLVERHIRPLVPRTIPLESADGLILAERVVAKGDSPPFAKSVVDGYSVRTADLSGPGPTRLKIVDEIDAGSLPKRALRAGEAALVMTGAPLPDDADAVVMLEHAEADAEFVQLTRPVTRGQNRLERGTEYRTGDVLCNAGASLGDGRIGLLASDGVTHVTAFPRPHVVVLTTGNELVPHAQAIGPGQIRDSNSLMLRVLLKSLGADCSDLTTGHIPDDFDSLTQTFRGLFDAPVGAGRPDMIVLSGGVSAGRRDLVPGALESVGIRRVFHKVALRPGKPLWFGVGPERTAGPPLVVFGLPGNPVSGLVCSLLFVKPALEILSGRPVAPLFPRSATLSTPYQHRGERLSCLPARVTLIEPTAVEPLNWPGSADLRTVADSDGFAVFEPGDRAYAAGERVGFIPRPEQ